MITQFSNLDNPAGKEINYVKNLEKITSGLKLIKNEEIIEKATYKKIKPVGSRPGIFCRNKGNKEKCMRRPGMDLHLSVQFCQLLVHLPTN